MKPNLTGNFLTKRCSFKSNWYWTVSTRYYQHCCSISLGSFCHLAGSVYRVSRFKNAAILQESRPAGRLCDMLVILGFFHFNQNSHMYRRIK